MSGRTVETWSTLVGHFVRSFFRLQFLDDAGQESFRRGLLGLLTVAIGLGLALSRLYLWKYKRLIASVDLERIVYADRLFIVAAPMLVTGAAIALVAPTIFPDELDFRILMALPLSRFRVFAAKFTALCLFAMVSILVPNFSIAVPLSVIVSGRLPGEAPMAAMMMTVIGGCWAAAFSIAAIVGVQAVVVGVVPRRYFHRASIALQSGILAGLVVALPFTGHLPGLWRVIDERPDQSIWIPPAWFLGASHWLFGNGGSEALMLARFAIASTVVALAVAIAASLAAYRRFDHAMSRSTLRYVPAWWNRPFGWFMPQHSCLEAIRDFMSVTIRRSNIHQLVVAIAFGVGTALAANSLVDSISSEGRWLARAILSVPFALMAGAVVGVRMALLIPTNIRAGWIFRLTEQAATRPHQLNAVRRGLLTSAVALPTVLGLPFAAGQFGLLNALSLAPITLLIGWAFVEVTCLDWRRLPFTCTLLLAKRPPVYTLFWLAMIFGWFVFVATTVLFVAASGTVGWYIAAGATFAFGLALRQYRLRTWGQSPLEFEDYLPDGLDGLRLRE